MLCHTCRFNNSRKLLGHLTANTQASSPCFEHYVLLVYREKLYPEEKLKIKNIEKQNNSNQK